MEQAINQIKKKSGTNICLTAQEAQQHQYFSQLMTLHLYICQPVYCRDDSVFFQWNFIMATNISSQVGWPSTEHMPAWSSVIWKLSGNLIVIMNASHKIMGCVCCIINIHTSIIRKKKLLKRTALFWRSWRMFKCQLFITAWSWTINEESFFSGHNF
jgi:hypothetical protein